MTSRPGAAQDSLRGGQQSAPATGSVTGFVYRVTARGERPVPRQWVIVHGIGAAGGRAIDSTRTGTTGSFRLAYPRGDSTAQYFLSTVHHGIAYVSGILPEEAGAEHATLSVFDTTSAAIPLVVRGRHILIFAPTDNPRRRVAEIFEISNDTTLTRVAGEGQPPVWTTPIPPSAQEFSSGPEMTSNEAIRREGDRVAAYAPVAPGLKRIAFTYALPPDAFPARFVIEERTDVFEVLIEDREGEVIGPGFEETPPSTIEGRTFRRFQGQAMAGPAEVIVRLRTTPPPARRTNPVLVGALAAVAVAAFAFALRRSRTRALSPAAAPPPAATDREADALAREIAALDAEFEQRPAVDDAARAAYHERRGQLKRELAERLAAKTGA